jgi:hypothetical protein
MRRYAVTLAGSVRPGVRQSTVIEVEASTTPQARLQTQRSHPGSTFTKILAIAVLAAKPLGPSTFPSDLCVQSPDGQKCRKHRPHPARALLNGIDSSAPCSHRTGAFSLCSSGFCTKPWIDVPQIRPWLAMQPYFN